MGFIIVYDENISDNLLLIIFMSVKTSAVEFDAGFLTGSPAWYKLELQEDTLYQAAAV